MKVVGLLVFALVTVVTLSACSQFGRRDRSGPRGLPSPSQLQPAGSLPSMGSQSPLETAASMVARKQVAQKKEPATLIAIDRTRCVVTSDQFRDARVGDNVICVWLAGDRAP